MYCSRRGRGILIGLSVTVAFIITVILGNFASQPVRGTTLAMQKKRITSIDWKSWLAQWNHELLKSLDFARYTPAPEDDLTPEVIASGWLGYSGATDKQIARLEARLGKRLPPSYRAFLKVSNGFRTPDTLVSRLLPAEKVEWFHKQNRELIDMWKSNGLEDLSGALLISAPDYFTSRDFLLNPRVVRPDGEWEALYFWPGGATCEHYSSFWELMQDQRRGFLLVNEMESRRAHTDDDFQAVIAKLPHLINKIGELEQARWTTPPNQEMSEAVMDYMFRGNNQKAASQISEPNEQAPKTPIPLADRIAKPQKKRGSQPSAYLISVSPPVNDARPDSKRLEAVFRQFLEYSDGVKEALRSAKSKVVEIQAKGDQPEDAYRELKLLERELKKKYQEYVDNHPGVIDYRGNLHDRETGFSQGCLMVAGEIGSFLNEAPLASWEVLKTHVTESAPPIYSSTQNVSATVVIIVNARGVVTKAYHREGDEGLGRAVAQAFRQWRFHPHAHRLDQSCEITARLVSGEVTLSSNDSGSVPRINK